jgi:TetR/AcrR family transcriptional regulator, cholesterol catabolism regulator
MSPTPSYSLQQLEQAVEPSSSPGEGRSVDRKAQILGHAARMFSEQGYQATSMRTLAEAVGIEAASLYSHFPSKESILRAIAWSCADDFFRQVEPIVRSSLHTRAKLRAMIVAHVEVLLRNQSASAVFADEWRQLGPDLRAAYSHLRDRYEQLFREVIYQGVVENLFRNAEPKYSALILLSALNGTAQWYRVGGPMSAAETAELLADVLIDGLVRHV